MRLDGTQVSERAHVGAEAHLHTDEERNLEERVLQLRRAAVQIISGGEDAGVKVLNAELREIVGNPIPQVQDVEPPELGALLEREHRMAEHRELDRAAQSDGSTAKHHRLERRTARRHRHLCRGVLSLRGARMQRVQ
jgi:hypothetical protein